MSFAGAFGRSAESSRAKGKALPSTADSRSLGGRFAKLSSTRSAKIDWTGWRKFVIAMLALAFALLLALYSSSAAEAGRMLLAGSTALAALAVAGWVAFTIVPVLARRTSIEWFSNPVDYRLTREGVVYLTGVFVVALAALNTGNNLLFMVLACLIAGILVSGVISQLVLRDVELRLDLPEHIFAGQTVAALAELVNHKQKLPSFSLRLVGTPRKNARGQKTRKIADTGKEPAQNGCASEILTTPVYFPYLPAQRTVQQSVQLMFARRGLYRQDSIGLQTRFPFGFLEKTRVVDSQLQAVVYPSIEPTEDFYEILPLVNGEIESFLRGRGNDLYSIRDYQTTDTARHVDWKASAKSGALQVREFAREDERRVLLVLDPSFLSLPSDGTPASVGPESHGFSLSVENAAGDPGAVASASAPNATQAAFDRGVALCASLAWHFYGLDSMLMFRTPGFETPMAPASEIVYDILGHLATVEPCATDSGRAMLDELSDSPQIFKIIVTGHPRGSIPPALWNSSYILFINS